MSKPTIQMAIPQQVYRIVKTVDHPNKLMFYADSIILRPMGETIHIIFMRPNPVPDRVTDLSTPLEVVQEVLVDITMSSNAFNAFIDAVYKSSQELKARREAMTKHVEQEVRQDDYTGLGDNQG